MSKFNFFDSMFDFNRDGKLGAFETGAKIGAIAHFMSDTKDDTTFGTGYSSGVYFDDDFEFDLDDSQISELEMAGVDVDELEFMDEDERREVLEDAGLDPDDYDDF